MKEAAGKLPTLLRFSLLPLDAFRCRASGYGIPAEGSE